jgi:hypothetical protein
MTAGGPARATVAAKARPDAHPGSLGQAPNRLSRSGRRHPTRAGIRTVAIPDSTITTPELLALAAERLEHRAPNGPRPTRGPAVTR